MAKGLLKKLALAGMVGASTMFSANEVKAAPFNWSSFSDIAQIPSEFRQTYTSSSTISAPNNLSGVYFMITSIGTRLAVGGFDVRNGQVTSSYFGNIGEAYTANSAEGSNPANSLEGYWRVFYDSNGDGNYGLADLDADGVFLNGAEQLGSTQYAISNFTAFDINNPGSFDFSTTVPEPTTSALLALGLSAVALRRRKPVFKQSSKYHK